MSKVGFVYILTNTHHTTLYVGVTSNIKKRIYDHQQKHSKSFSATYNLNKLVYVETCESIEVAITREKQLKAGSRSKKIALIDSQNPAWEDLSTML
ncbi:MAG: GIY-YIG nuclease family protein [Vampirovibrionales bacterium]